MSMALTPEVIGSMAVTVLSVSSNEDSRSMLVRRS